MLKKVFALAVLALCVWYVMKPARTEIKNLHNPGEVIVAFGDSLTAGYGAPEDQSYPARLARLAPRRVINLGRNGETAVDAPARLQTALDYQPYMVLIEFGGNDFMRGLPLERTVAALAEMVDRVQAAGAVAVVVDTGGYPAMRAYTRAYKKLAQEKGAVFVPGILDGIFGKRQYQSDAVHPNAAGYERVAARVYQAIEPYVK